MKATLKKSNNETIFPSLRSMGPGLYMSACGVMRGLVIGGVSFIDLTKNPPGSCGWIASEGTGYYWVRYPTGTTLIFEED